MGPLLEPRACEEADRCPRVAYVDGDEHVDVFEGDFKKQHTPGWWRYLFENSGLLHVDTCEHLDDAAVLFEEMVRHEYELNLDPFNVQICLQQMEWDRHHEPKRSLFVISAHKKG
jgi:hypothetical protein